MTACDTIVSVVTLGLLGKINDFIPAEILVPVAFDNLRDDLPSQSPHLARLIVPIPFLDCRSSRRPVSQNTMLDKKG